MNFNLSVNKINLFHCLLRVQSSLQPFPSNHFAFMVVWWIFQSAIEMPAERLQSREIMKILLIAIPRLWFMQISPGQYCSFIQFARPSFRFDCIATSNADPTIDSSIWISSSGVVKTRLVGSHNRPADDWIYPIFQVEKNANLRTRKRFIDIPSRSDVSLGLSFDIFIHPQWSHFSLVLEPRTHNSVVSTPSSFVCLFRSSESWAVSLRLGNK